MQPLISRLPWSEESGRFRCHVGRNSFSHGCGLNNLLSPPCWFNYCSPQGYLWGSGGKMSAGEFKQNKALTENHRKICLVKRLFFCDCVFLILAAEETNISDHSPPVEYRGDDESFLSQHGVSNIRPSYHRKKHHPGLMWNPQQSKSPSETPIKPHSTRATGPHERDFHIDFKTQTLSPQYGHSSSSISINIAASVSSSDFNKISRVVL